MEMNLQGLDKWITEGPRIDETPEPWCSIYDKPCLHNGEECGDCCMREEESRADSDPASDYADWSYHQGIT